MESALGFLKSLKGNNNRDWFNENKSLYQKSSDEFKSFTSLLIAGINEFDDSAGSVDPKDCIFRIYRDVRFSHDKAPFKTNFGAYIAKGGRKSPYAGYYFHLDAEASFASGGIYMAPSDVMKRIREDIDLYPEEFLSIVDDKKFKETFQFFEEEKLKRVPQGFDKDSPVVEYLKFKHITPYHSLSEKDIADKNLLKKTLDIYKSMKPLVDFLNRSIRGMKE
ncbi:MAG: DUF2461 domain-containing protein [Bacteroidales bacterium]|nr:MAG: DUF2461 domain-containing protein [Bacteroidales bacterium]